MCLSVSAQDTRVHATLIGSFRRIWRATVLSFAEELPDMTESLRLTWSIFKVAVATAGAAFLLLLVLMAVALAADALARRRKRSRGEGEGRSGIYAGRVWHARFKPTAHRFSYPIFYCLIDLDELDVAFPWYIWPVGSARLPALSRFRPSDHLKDKVTASTAEGGETRISSSGGDSGLGTGSAAGGNRAGIKGDCRGTGGVASEGSGAGGGTGGGARGVGERHEGVSAVSRSKATKTSSPPSLSHHADRVRDIVEEATGARPAGRVQLLTHLAYLGYCFNPVSFYYCLDETERKIETVVAEVSNTPWGEMHCYVLNPKTKGVEVLSRSDGKDKDEDKEGVQGPVRYRFEKDFHVSPFMSMKHTYDWKFTAPDAATPGSGLTAQTTLLEPESGKIFFDAKLVLKRQPCFSAAALLWHMTVYPLYTVWMQILIHYQAFRLWWKEVPFYPHPEGAETAASRLVAVVMTPLFNAQAAWAERSRRRKDNAESGVSAPANGVAGSEPVGKTKKA